MSQHLTLMAVHAHPDDEATGTGGVLAKAADEGVRTVLVTCTDGRCGDGPGGIKPGDPAHDPEAVVAMRAAELARSCEILGVNTAVQLGYRDSGMMGWATNDAPGSFWSSPVAEPAARLAELMRRHRPDVVVTYDENGFYGHPDHIQAHRITAAALDLLSPDEHPAKVYWTTIPRSGFARFGQVMRELGADWDEPDENGSEPPAFEMGLPDDEVTTWVDIRAFGDQKFDALAAHASQGDNMMFMKMGRELFVELMGTETFSRVRDTTGAPVLEHDLFAGLRPRDPDDFRFAGSTVVARPPQDVYDLVSDVTRTGEWSPICRACWWDDGAGPEVGAWFNGRNETPARTWETRSQVVAAEPGREFAWKVGGRYTRWGYLLEPVDGGTRLTETWEFLPEGRERFTELWDNEAPAQIADRIQAARTGIPATLAAIKATLEGES